LIISSWFNPSSPLWTTFPYVFIPFLKIDMSQMTFCVSAPISRFFPFCRKRNYFSYFSPPPPLSYNEGTNASAFSIKFFLVEPVANFPPPRATAILLSFFLLYPFFPFKSLSDGPSLSPFQYLLSIRQSFLISIPSLPSR